MDIRFIDWDSSDPKVDPFSQTFSDIERKLLRIEIPTTGFSGTSFEAMTLLQEKAILYDHEAPDPASKGVEIICNIEGEDEPNVTITLSSMPLGNMIQFITEIVGWSLMCVPAELWFRRTSLDGASN